MHHTKTSCPTDIVHIQWMCWTRKGYRSTSCALSKKWNIPQRAVNTIDLIALCARVHHLKQIYKCFPHCFEKTVMYQENTHHMAYIAYFSVYISYTHIQYNVYIYIYALPIYTYILSVYMFTQMEQFKVILIWIIRVSWTEL